MTEIFFTYAGEHLNSSINPEFISNSKKIVSHIRKSASNSFLSSFHEGWSKNNVSIYLNFISFTVTELSMHDIIEVSLTYLYVPFSFSDSLIRIMDRKLKRRVVTKFLEKEFS